MSSGIPEPLCLSGPAKDGIPWPVLDEMVWYLGEGIFKTESGRIVCWKGGRFENEDGSPLAVPESINAKLRSKGLSEVQQPTAWSLGLDSDKTPAAAVLTPRLESGAYLHTGGVRAESYGKTGLAADVSVFDRSVGYREYYLISWLSDSGPIAAFQISDYSDDCWVPNIHFTYEDGPDAQYSYWDYAFGTYNGSVTRNIKMARNSGNGRWNVYLDATPIDYDLYWPYDIYSIRPYTQVELGSPNTFPPHDPGNHYSYVRLRATNYSSWAYQTGTVTWWRRLIEVATQRDFTPTYGYIQFVAQYYDWMLRD